MSEQICAFPAHWNWRLFAAPGIPEDFWDPTEGIGENLPLPDGRVLTGKEFHFPENGIAEMRDYMDFEPEVLSRTVMTADFEEKEAGKICLGVGVDWEFTLYLNGEKLCSTRKIGNGESRITPYNHGMELKYRAGHNQLVWELFNGERSFLVAAGILANAELKLKYGPWTDFPDGAEKAVTIVFAASRKTPAGVDYRKKGTEKWIRRYDNLGGQIRRDTEVHCIRLKGLEPDTVYEYRIVLLNELACLEEQVQEGIHVFRSAPDAGKEFRFTVTSDIQRPLPERKEFLRTLLQSEEGKKSDFFAFLGDINWTSDFDLDCVEGFVLPAIEYSGKKMLVMVRGNHEIYGRDTNRFFTYFNAPAPGREGYTLFRWGDVCFIQLDFCDDAGRQSYPSTRDLHDFEPYIEEEAQWLRQAVKLPVCTEAKYRIVLAHGIAVGDLQQYMPGHIRQVIDPVFSGKDPVCSIHLWLGGHVHYPLRSIPGENAWRCSLNLNTAFPPRTPRREGDRYFFTTAVMSGPGGKNPADLQMSGMHLHVSDAGIEVRSCTETGETYDHFLIRQDRSVQELGSAEWFRRWEY